MQDLIETFFSDDKNLELYLGTIETVESIFKKHPKDAWRQIIAGNKEISQAITNDIVNSGLLALGVPEEYGGLGGGFVGSMIVTDLMGQHGVLSFDLVEIPFCRKSILEHGSVEQIEKYVVPSLTGDISFCICVTEPDAGSNTFRIKTKAVKKGDKWILNGQKVYISGADKADYGFLVARTDMDAPGALSIFTVDMKAPGIVRQRQNTNVFPNEDQFSVFFDNVELGEDALIGEEGFGAKYMFAGLNAERFIGATMCTGMSDRALSCTTEYVNQRIVFGDKPTGAYQAVQQPLAQNKANTDAARIMAYFGAKLWDQGKDAGSYANMAKLLASEAFCKMCDDAIQFHGGSGMDEDTGLIALWKIARISRIAPINNEMIRNYIAEHMLGLPKSY